MEDSSENEVDDYDVSKLPPFYALRLNEALRTASQHGHRTWVLMLLLKGADVNDRDRVDNMTALDKAILYGHEAIAEMLIGTASEETIKAAVKLIQERKDHASAFLEFLRTEKGAPKEAAVIASEGNGESGKQIQQLKEQIQSLEQSNGKIKAELDQFKLDKSAKEKEWEASSKKLSEELEKEKDEKQDLEKKVKLLESVVQLREQEIVVTKNERDSERRAKENAKRILSTDGVDLPSISPSPPVGSVNFTSASPRNPRRLSKAASAMSLYVDAITVETPSIPSAPSPQTSPSAPARTKDDMATVIGDSIKSRVRRLVRRWEDMKGLP